jgi:tetratricopeptide (TPR) repeat protein
VDELVVVDTGSGDRTPEIAQAAGAQVYHFDWCDDFSAARNAALQYVHSDWVLVLDADETLVPESVPHLHHAIQQPHYLVINLLREEVGAQQSPYSMVSRLFRRHPQIYWSRPYHALIDDSVLALQAQEPDWQIGYLDAVAIRHHGYNPQIIASQNKAGNARQAMEGFLAQHPQDAYVCSKLGALYVELGEIEAGIALLRRGLNTQPLDCTIAYELHYHLGNAYTTRDQPEIAQQHYHQALAQNLPERLKIGAYNNGANLQRAAGDLAGARQGYEHLVAIDPGLAIAHYNLGLTLKALGELPSAIEAYQQAIHLRPDYADAHQNLGVALFKQGRVQAGLQSFDQAMQLHEQQQNPAEANRIRQELVQMGLWSPQS